MNDLLQNQNRTLVGSQQTFLDVARIIAAYMVMLGHSFGYYQLTIFKDETYFPYIQNIGVVILFLISGFLNAYSLENKNSNRTYEFQNFFKHKVVRILREYLPGLVFIAVIDGIYIVVNGDNYSYYGAYNIKQFVGNMLFLQGTYVGNYLGIVPFGSGRPLWTLALEWWFYLLFGFLYLVMANRRKVTAKKGALFAIVLIQPIDYLIGGRGSGLGFVFLLGVLAFYCYDVLSKRLSYFIFLMSLVLYIVYCYRYREAYTVYSYVILWLLLCSGCKVFQGGHKKRGKISSFISQSTFMLYLIHYSIIEYVYYSQWNIFKVFKWFTGVFMSVAFSMILYYFFGYKKLLERLYKSNDDCN